MLHIIDFSEHINCGALKKNNDDFFFFAVFFVEDFIVNAFHSNQSLQLLFHQSASFFTRCDKTIIRVFKQSFAQKDWDLVSFRPILLVYTYTV